MALGPIRSWIYDTAILPLTTAWYGEVLARLPGDARLLDVGIGTGGALLAHAATLRRKRIRVVGVDVDEDYVRRCRDRVAAAGLAEVVDVRLESVTEHRGGPYDAVYWSGSFMLMPDPVGALQHVRTLLAPSGAMYFTQTFERDRSKLAEIAKPLLRWVTTIDFGRVTYEEEFRARVAAGGLDLVELVELDSDRSHGSHGSHGSRGSRGSHGSHGSHNSHSSHSPPLTPPQRSTTRGACVGA